MRVCPGCKPKKRFFAPQLPSPYSVHRLRQYSETRLSLTHSLSLACSLALALYIYTQTHPPTPACACMCMCMYLHVHHGYAHVHVHVHGHGHEQVCVCGTLPSVRNSGEAPNHTPPSPWFRVSKLGFQPEVLPTRKPGPGPSG
jgi:hypothetical protein